MLAWICLLVAVYIMDVPFRGSLLALFVVSSLFLGCALGMGLFLSTVMRNQFNAAQAALTAAFLPAMMLSGFVFEIASMPQPLQWLTPYHFRPVTPARCRPCSRRAHCPNYWAPTCCFCCCFVSSGWD